MADTRRSDGATASLPGGYDRPGPTLPSLLVAVVVSAACGLGAYSSTFVELDLGWALDNGADTLASGLQRANTETFVEPGYPVVMHSWAANVILALLHRAGGGPALALAHACLVAMVAASTAAACFAASRKPLPAVVAALFGMLLVPYAFLYLRAQLFSCLMLPLVVAAMQRRRLSGYLALLPLIALWANLHGGVALGVGLAVCGLGIEVARTALGRGGRIPVRAGLMVMLGLAGAALLNPWGLGVFLQAGGSTVGRHTDLLTEWYPAWHPAVVRAAGWQYLGLLVAAGVLVWRMWRSPERMVVVVSMIALSILAVRHARLAPLALAPLVAEVLSHALRRFSVRAAALVLGLLATVGLGGTVVRAGNLAVLRTAPGIAPVTVLAALAGAPQGTRVWNDFDVGGALLWACPQCLVAIDGRAIAAYSPGHLVEMLEPTTSTFVRRIEASDAALVITRDPQLLEELRGFRKVACAGFCLLARDGSEVPLQDVPARELTMADLFAAPGRPFP